MTELLGLCESRRGEKDERLRLVKLKEEHRRTMAEIGSEDIGDPKIQRKAADAQLGIALVDARMAKLQVPDRDFDKIDALHRVEGKRYNEAVLRARDAAFDEMIDSQLKFFGGDKSACRDYFKRVRPPHPMLFPFQKALHHHPTGPREQRDVIREIDSFLAKMQRNAKLLGMI
ncbi:MAG: hypothetical protein NT154_09420 [Verrucomicrobia bacterium]|nr:hypothetical protein [Verrucomicrobiota bacterium]